MIDEYRRAMRTIEVLKSELQDWKDECAKLHNQLEESFKGVLSIRCSKHLGVPQQNRNEHSGGECGGCIAEERDRAYKQGYAKGAEDKLAEVSAFYGGTR